MIYLYIYIASVVISFIIALIREPKSTPTVNIEDLVIDQYERKSPIWALAIICILLGPIMPFVFLYNFCKKLYYRNRPRPVPKDKRELLHCDTVLNENNLTISLSEYNLMHGTSFTLDQVYGKGYESSLSDEDKKQIRKFGEVEVSDNLIDDVYTLYSKKLGEAIVSGDFSEWDSCLNDDVELTIYENKTIEGSNNVLQYWKEWREKYFVTKKAFEFKVVHSNYYSRSCLLLSTMLAAMNIENGKVTKMVFSGRYIAGGYYSHHDDLVEDSPFDYSYIKKYLKPFNNGDNNEQSPVLTNRMPCLSCNLHSEDLEWYSSFITVGIHGYPAQVSICPKCGKVIEYRSTGRVRFEEPIVDQLDMLEEYAN